MLGTLQQIYVHPVALNGACCEGYDLSWAIPDGTPDGTPDGMLDPLEVDATFQESEGQVTKLTRHTVVAQCFRNIPRCRHQNGCTDSPPPNRLRYRH